MSSSSQRGAERLRVKRWSDFQHYRNRNPPWIKLHRSLLNDRDFMALGVASKALAPMLWLLAAESSDGTVSGDPAELAFRLRMPEKDVSAALEPLLRAGFFERASNTLAGCLQVAPESCSETETETETETEKRASKRAVVRPPDGVSDAVWSDFVRVRKAKRAPLTELALKGIADQAALAGWTLERALTECVVRGWQAFKAEWVAGNGRSNGHSNKGPAYDLRNPDPNRFKGQPTIQDW